MVHGGVSGFLNGNTRRINTAHLTGTDANGAFIFGKYNGIGFDMFGNRPCKQQIIKLGVGWRGFCHDFQS